MTSVTSEALVGPSLAQLWKTRRDRDRFQWSSLLMLTPAFGLLIILFLIPVGYAVYLGFTNLTLVGPDSVHWGWSGMTNVTRLRGDQTFSASLSTTGWFVGGSILGVVVFGYALASLLMRAASWVRVIVGGVVVVAWMMPAITAGMTWYASTTAGGTFASLANMSSSDFLGSQPLLIVTLANVWSQTGFAMLVIGAALRNIPGEILEAADVENVSRWQRFRFIILPQLRSTLTAVVLLVALLTLANFSLIYVMTQGGPGNATNILPLYSYQQAFQFNNLAYGALIGNVMVVLAALFGVFYVRAARPRS